MDNIVNGKRHKNGEMVDEVKSILNELMYLRYCIKNLKEKNGSEQENNVEDVELKKLKIEYQIRYHYNNLLTNVIDGLMANDIMNISKENKLGKNGNIEEQAEEISNNYINYLKTYMKSKLKEEKLKYKWVNKGFVLKKTNPLTYTVSTIFALNIYMCLEEKYGNSNWEDIFEILKFKKEREMFHYLIQNSKEYIEYKDSEKIDYEKVFEKMYINSIKYLEKIYEI